MNLHAFITNDGVNAWDLLGLLEILIRSEYGDGNGNPKDRDEIWSIINNPVTVEVNGKTYTFPPPLRHEHLADHSKGGETKEDSIPEVKANGCLVSGEIYHYVLSLTMNTNPRRNKIFWNYWATAHHEVMHIQATLRRMKAIAEKVKPWEDVFDSEFEARMMAAFYKGMIKVMVNDANEKETNHDTSGGFETPGEGVVYPGWEGPK